ncbi:MAG: transcription-repair coupling factor [Proteobacteria bacterium]|nr:transcription-repair coupling factor [Pseudomonadota bacterium]
MASSRSSGLEREQAIIDALAAGSRVVVLHGAQGAPLALTLTRLAQLAPQRPLLVITADDDGARTLGGDLAFFSAPSSDDATATPAVVVLPAPASSPYAEMAPDRGALLGRMTALFQLQRARDLAREHPLVVCSAPALQRQVVPPQLLAALSLRLTVGATVDRDTLLAQLVAAGYERCPVVDDPGTFAVRGGIVDLFPPLYRYPTRLELLGDEIESLRLFDPATQRTLRRCDEVLVHPVSELLRPAGHDVRGALLALADELHHPTRATRALLDEIEHGHALLGAATLAPAFCAALVPLWRYLPANVCWVLVDPEALQQTFVQQLEHHEQLYRQRLAAGRLAYPPAAFFSAEEAIASASAAEPRLEVRATTQAGDHALSLVAGDNAELIAHLKRARAARGDEIITALTRDLEALRDEGRPVLIAAGDASHSETLRALFEAHGLSPRELPAPTPGALGARGAPLPESAAPQIYLRHGHLSAGFRLPGGWVVIAHDEIFGPKTTRQAPRRAQPGGARADLRELRLGDAVVHSEHGIGRYQGLVQLQVAGVQSDFLLLEYAGGDRLYLPVYRMHQVHRYVGSEGGAPRLDRLGGSTWQKKQRKVAGDVRRIGEELLQLYAQRAALTGHAYPAPGPDFIDFEQTFPFTETPDQLQAIQATLADLTSERPMDRLVCGDVGFGKTEVALRAAYLVAAAGRQVAVLAPTTVLVEQHYRTFRERMAPYPLRVESVSRFRSTRELRQVLADLAAGRVDIVIGTHRLLSADVQFRELGLLVLDEEQRFGVVHKERMKRWRTQVDVLALTATPIPRTLQLSLAGLREISVITTPPQDRLAIRTVLCRWDDAVVANAIRKELGRGGQVFFVHNEVQTIEQCARRVAELVPEARLVIGHGKMDARRLERVMLDFVAGRFDVLVCTTIIEAGLDIPRANTMLVDHADRFGLSQLYQLRGRIGRSHLRAYCFLLLPPFGELSDEARVRLELLQQFTQLGSGFSIASYDLELRGAGDLLGDRQSGHIAAVGFDAYARILEEAVAELRGQPIRRETDPEINAQIAAFIPDDYVEDTGQRLELYQRLSHAASDEAAVGDILAEMRDRYGTAPREVDALGQLMVIKGLAARLRARVVDLGAGRLALTLEADTPLSSQRIRQLVAAPESGFRLLGPARLSRRLRPDEQPQPLAAAQRILHTLLASSR